MSLDALGTSWRTVLRNTTSRSIGAVVTLATGAISGILVARHLGPEGFGQFSVIWSVAWALALLVPLGLDRVLVREIPRPGGVAALSDVLPIVTAAGVVVAAMFVAVTVVVGATPSVLLATVIAGVYVAVSGATSAVGAVFSANERMGLGTILHVTEGAVALGGVVVTLLADGGLFAVSASLTAGRLANLLMAALVLRREGTLAMAPEGPRPAPLPALVRLGLPMAGSRVVNEGIRRADIVVLGLLLAPTDAGLYSAASVVAIYVPQLLREHDQALFPALARARSAAHPGLGVVFRQTWRAYTVIGLAAAAGLAVLAGPILQFLYEPPYTAAETALAVLAWMVPLRLLSSLCATTLEAVDREPTRLAVSTAALVVNVATVLVLAPRLGILGAAIATVITDLVQLVGLAVVLRKLLPLRHSYVMASAALALLVAVAAAVTPGHVFVRVLAGGAVFAVGAAVGSRGVGGRARANRGA